MSGTRRCLLAVLLLAATSAAAVRADDVFDPYKIPREQFRARVSKIALRPFQLPPDAVDREQTIRSFEQRITNELTQRGYVVVPSSEFRETWRRLSSDLGGVYDPVSGASDEEKHRLAWAYTLRELERRLDVDVVLVSSIRFDLVRAYSEGGIWNLTWWAVLRPLLWHNEPMRGALAMPQRVDGAYLDVSMFDRSELPLYGVRAPIQWGRIFARGDYVELPARQLYRDEERNQASVRVVFQALEARGAAGR